MFAPFSLYIPLMVISMFKTPLQLLISGMLDLPKHKHVYKCTLKFMSYRLQTLVQLNYVTMVLYSSKVSEPVLYLSSSFAVHAGQNMCQIV